MTARDITMHAAAIVQDLLNQGLNPNEIIAVLETAKTATLNQAYLDHIQREQDKLLSVKPQ